MKADENQKKTFLCSSFLAQKPKTKKYGVNRKIMDVDLESLKTRKAEKEKSIYEKLSEVQITQTEKKSLDKVFALLSNKKTYFNCNDIKRVLGYLGVFPTRSEIELMIWEIDDNLNGEIDDLEFLHTYKKCITDKIGLEPKSLFNMVQFLMFCKKEKYTITVEDTLELLFVRMGRVDLDEEIRAIFGAEEKAFDGSEKEISFSEYLEKINSRAIEVRKEKQKEKSLYGKLIKTTDNDG